MNPNRDKRQHALTWDGRSNEPDLALLRSTAPFYRITDPAEAQSIMNEIADVVSTWREKAKTQKLPSIEIQAMETVFAV